MSEKLDWKQVLSDLREEDRRDDENKKRHKQARFALDNATCTLEEYMAVNPGEGKRDYCRAILEMLGWKLDNDLIKKMCAILESGK
jgi:hypothetical protein